MSFYSINAHASILNEVRTEYVGSEGEAFEGASWHAGKLTRGDPGIAASAQDMMGSGPSLIRCACQKVRPDPVFGPHPR